MVQKQIIKFDQMECQPNVMFNEYITEHRELNITKYFRINKAAKSCVSGNNMNEYFAQRAKHWTESRFQLSAKIKLIDFFLDANQFCCNISLLRHFPLTTRIICQSMSVHFSDFIQRLGSDLTVADEYFSEIIFH